MNPLGKPKAQGGKPGAVQKQKVKALHLFAEGVKAVREGSEKALPFRCAQENRAISPPLPARRPNLSDTALCNEYTDTSRLAPIPNRIVNLTLTTQRRPQQRENAPSAWTMQSSSCKTNRGMRVRDSRTDVSRRAERVGQGRINETSFESRVFRILGREAR